MTLDHESQDVPWYRAAFDDLYPFLYSHRDDESARQEVEALIRLFNLAPGLSAGHGESRPDLPGENGGAGHAGAAPRPEAPRRSGARPRVLDACCGAGRHADALARAGFNVAGIDLSGRLLVEAAARPSLQGRLARAEIRAIPFGPVFDLVVNLFTSYGYFEDDAENLRALRELVRVLRPGGRLILDHMNRAHVERTLVEKDEDTRGGFTIRQRRRIDRNRIIKRIDVLDGAGRHVALTENVRLYTPEEMRALFQTAGLHDVRLFGSFAGDPLGPQSDRMIATGLKPEGATP